MTSWAEWILCCYRWPRTVGRWDGLHPGSQGKVALLTLCPQRGLPEGPFSLYAIVSQLIGRLRLVSTAGGKPKNQWFCPPEFRAAMASKYFPKIRKAQVKTVFSVLLCFRRRVCLNDVYLCFICLCSEEVVLFCFENLFIISQLNLFTVNYKPQTKLKCRWNHFLLSLVLITYTSPICRWQRENKQHFIFHDDKFVF